MHSTSHCLSQDWLPQIVAIILLCPQEFANGLESPTPCCRVHSQKSFKCGCKEQYITVLLIYTLLICILMAFCCSCLHWGWLSEKYVPAEKCHWEQEAWACCGTTCLKYYARCYCTISREVGREVHKHTKNLWFTTWLGCTKCVPNKLPWSVSL